VYFKQFLHDETGCSSYFIASRQSREAAVVDPQYEIQPYLDLAAQRDYHITHVIDTHLHADHISGNRALAAATGAGIHLHECADVLFPFTPLHEGDDLDAGQAAPIHDHENQHCGARVERGGCSSPTSTCSRTIRWRWNRSGLRWRVPRATSTPSQASTRSRMTRPLDNGPSASTSMLDRSPSARFTI